MNKKLLIVSGLLLTQLAHAEWYYRGTSNEWAATALEQTDTNKYETCQTFVDANARFKIDRFGDWSENYPLQDRYVTTGQSYKIIFWVDTKIIEVSSVSSCDSTSTFFPSLNFRGTPNGWTNSAMTLADGVWTVDIEFDGSTDQRFKFDVQGDWSNNYGDGGNQTITQNGGDIYTDVSGIYEVSVDDQTLAYDLTYVGGYINKAPTAVISPAGNQTVVVGTTLNFSGADSSDPDGSVMAYDWSTGDSTEAISVYYDTVGTQTISLTVTDNEQALSQPTSVTVTVIDENPSDTWYFRGTPNGWATEAMETTDNINFCTEQTFGNDAPPLQGRSFW